MPTVKLADFGISILLEETRASPSLERLTPNPEVMASSSERNAAFAPTLPSAALDATTEPAAEEALAQAKTEAARTEAASAGKEVLARARTEAANDHARSQRELTRTGSIIGTPRYMAPELLLGSKNAQPASDVFSFGVIAFELLTSRMPFAGPAILANAQQKELGLPSMRDLCPELPAAIATLLENCLSFVPTQRPSSQEVSVAFTESEHR